ncbi:MAG: bifunctional DNA-formamidopyrimidine glycosylase/DNA-(apurinic or apyrimidinic site) lyase [Candidatus Nanopelagicaceae bacterium]
MPELPEVETVRSGLEKHVIGKTIVSTRQLHPRALRADSLNTLRIFKDATIKAVKRRGKFMWFEFNRPEVLVAHLGMSGQFKIQKIGSPSESHLRANFTLSNGREMRFIDQRTFGWLAVDLLDGKIPNLVSHIARDPFDSDFDKRSVVKQISSKRGQIKKVILDQEVISGIGNIYADEALWRARIHPETIASDLSATQILNLITAATKIMERALAAGGTSFDELYINVNGESGYFERSLAVYGREGEPCRRTPRCGEKIIRIAFANRSSRLCPACQTR